MAGSALTAALEMERGMEMGVDEEERGGATAAAAMGKMAAMGKTEGMGTEAVRVKEAEREGAVVVTEGVEAEVVVMRGAG